jgi:hypothetical protein
MLVFTIIFGQIARLLADGTAPLPLDGPRRQTGMLENSRLMLPTVGNWHQQANFPTSLLPRPKDR